MLAPRRNRAACNLYFGAVYVTKTTIRPLTVLALTIAACAPTAAPLPELPAVVEVTARDFVFTAPDTVAAGAITFRFTNAGPDIHHLVIVPLPEGKSGADLVADSTALPTWITMMGGPSVVSAGATTETGVTLAPGRYAMICLIPRATDNMPHRRLGMMKEFVAVPARLTGAMSVTPTHTIVLKDYDFEFSAPLKAGRAVIQFENRGPQPHEVGIARLHDDVTVEQALAWRRIDKTPEPYDLIGGVSPMQAGGQATYTVDFVPGRYAMVCFVPDTADGKPHVAHGMLKVFTID